jgi:hypothetical protein
LLRHAVFVLRQIVSTECFQNQQLLNHYGNAIIVEKQRGQGKSNTVFSSSITVSEAIHAANNKQERHRKCIFVNKEIISYAIYELLKSACMLRLFFDWHSV